MTRTFVEDFSKYTNGELLKANPFVYETTDLIYLVKELQNRLKKETEHYGAAKQVNTNN